MDHIVKIISITQVTHDVKSYRFEKPEGYQFEPGQATDVSINQGKWKDEVRPFTFTALNQWDHLEFTIKSYRDHDGVTNALDNLVAGDELIIRDVWGAITYKGEGYFIAGGAGITPFIAILRQLKKDDKLGNNQLFFSNKTMADIILRPEWDDMMGDNVHYVLTQDAGPDLPKQHIDKAYLQEHIKDFSKPFYLCGPDKMVQGLTDILKQLGADAGSVIFEK